MPNPILSSQAPPPRHLPQRVSLTAQTVSVLKQDIASGLWERTLPGEHALCEQLRVSRVTLRNALEQLQREGWLSSSQGRRRKIARRRRAPGSSTDRVLLLTPAPLQSLHVSTIFWIDSLREHLAAAGYRLEVHTSRAAFSSHLAHTLQSFKDHFRPAAWVLHRSTDPMQRWFSERGLPCLITGSRHAGVNLPSVDLDYRATCRHAAGQFLARGHRSLVLLNPESGAAGDLESEQGFQEAVQGAAAGSQGSVVRHDGTVAGICTKLDVLLQRSNRPTAFLVSRPTHVLTVLGHLARRGVRVPQDAALISRDDDSFLENVVPAVTRYSYSPPLFARKVSKVVLELARGGAVTSDLRLMPRYLRGETVGPPLTTGSAPVQRHV